VRRHQNPRELQQESCKGEEQSECYDTDIVLKRPVNETTYQCRVPLTMNGDSMLCSDASDVPRNRITNCFVYGNDLALGLPQTVMGYSKIKKERVQHTSSTVKP
jgi:hypothetical protein